MLTRLQAEISGGIIVVALGGVGFHSWLGEHDARLHAETVVETSAKAAKDAEAKMRVVQDGIDARDRQAAEDRAKYLDAIGKLKTAPQILPFVQKEIAPSAPVPITVNIPPATKDDPTPDAIVKIPQIDLPAVRDRFAKCDLDAAAITTCTKDGADLKEKIRLAGEVLSQTENERDAYKTELKGGTFWRRTKTAVKIAGIAVVGTVAAMCGSGHCK